MIRIPKFKVGDLIIHNISKRYSHRVDLAPATLVLSYCPESSIYNDDAYYVVLVGEEIIELEADNVDKYMDYLK